MKTTVTVDITVTIECSSTWMDDCRVSQIKKEAREEAAGVITRAFEKNPLVKNVRYGQVVVNAIT